MNDNEDSTALIGRDDLLRILQAGGCVVGRQSIQDVLEEEPHALVVVSEALLPPVGIDIYRVRRDRWLDGAGPLCTGIEDFVQALEQLRMPARAASVRGKQTAYVLVLDREMRSLITSTAVEQTT